MKDMIKEAEGLRKEIQKGLKEYPQEMFFAFCVVLFNCVKDDYNDLVSGLELTEDDRLAILTGKLNKKIEDFWEDIESVIEHGTLVLNEFYQEAAKKSKN